MKESIVEAIRSKNLDSLLNELPYLRMFNLYTNKLEESYTYLQFSELPDGWNLLFLQLCEDIYQPLKDSGKLNDFYFTQVKEKYGEMVCYENFRIPEINDIITKYEHMSAYICELCGKEASNVNQKGYFFSCCQKCADELKKNGDYHFIPCKFEPSFYVAYFENLVKTEKELNCEEEWQRYFENFEKYGSFINSSWE